MASSGPLSNEPDDSLENIVGADICNEIFGDPENPGTLLWMADGLYYATKKVLTCLSSPFSSCAKLKPE